MKSLNRFAALAALSSTFSSLPLAHADNPRAVPQQNRVFEAQADLGSLGSLNLDWFRENAILNEGQVTTNYNTILAVPNSPLREAQHGVNVELQSRIWGFCMVDYARRHNGQCQTWHSDENGNRVYTPVSNQDHGHLLPFEVTARLQVQPGQDTRVLLQNLRVGLGRLIWNSVGITLQGLSYVYKDRLMGQGSSHAFEAAQVSINEVVRLDRNGQVAVVFKGYARGGFSDFRNSQGPVDQSITAQSPTAASVANTSTFGGWLQAGGSVGMRFINRILASVLVDYEVQGGFGDDTVRDSHGNVTNHGFFARTIRNTTVGGALRVQITPAVAASLYLQRSYIRQSSQFDLVTSPIGGPDTRDQFRAQQDTAPVEGGAVFEVRY